MLRGMKDEEKAKMAALGAVIFALLESLDKDTVANVHDLLLSFHSDVSGSGNPSYEEFVKGELERFIMAAEDVIRHG